MATMNTLILDNNYLPLLNHKIPRQPALLLSLWYFQAFAETAFQTILQQIEQESTHQEKGQRILCAACHHPITASIHKIEINTTHHHRFTNPTGFTFEIGCFTLANGCELHGTPTLEHTWFQGFTWRYALCAHCHNHLGWFYQATNDSFYGLILNRLQNEEI
jgi:hypothetical protein